MINNTTLIGNITRETELKVTQSGKSVCNFTVAVNNRHKSRDGEVENNALFMRCTLWGERAEKLQPYLTKGQKFAVSGSLRPYSYTDNNGTNREGVELTVFNLELCGSKPKSSAGSYRNDDEPPF